MAKAIELIGWFVFNVAIPLLAPLALLPMAKLPYFYRDRSHGIVRRAVENGQLLWSAIPLNTGACYLLASWVEQGIGNRQWIWMFLTLHGAFVVAASVMVLLGTIDAYPNRRKKGQPNWILGWSIGLSCASATCYCLAHFYIAFQATTA
nr:hypothetical protein [uncultured Cupriavidus sp.]